MLAGEVLYFKDIKYTVTSGADAAVHTWYDQSGNSNDATQEADANQPLIAQDGNFLNELDFDGSEDMALATGSFSLTQAYTTFSVSHTDDASTSQGVWSTGSSITGTFNATSLFRGDDGFAVNSGITITTAGTINYVADRTYLQTNVVNGASSSIFVDGATGVTGNVGSTNPSGILILGFFRQNDGNNINLDGGIKELIIYNSDQTANRFKIESNINNHHTIYSAAQNGFVNTWYDQSGNGFNAVADADANEPKIVNSGSLLTDGLKFSLGNNLKLSGTGLDIFKNTQYAQVFYVIKINDTSTALTGFFEAQNNASQSRFLLRNSNATAGRISLGGRRLDGDSFSSFQSNSGHSNAKIVLAGFINYSDEEAFIFKNGTQIGSNTSFLDAGRTSDTRSTNIAIGRASANNTAEFDAEELIIFNISQAANQTAIETNMINHYGIIS
jgi:hypothetical protein